MADQSGPQPFWVKDCALAAIATGDKASRLDEFRDKLAIVPLGCLYQHFWGGRLHTRFTHPDYHNDFSAWAHHGLHDLVLAERLNIIDPTEYENLEGLRYCVLEVVDQRLDEQETVPVSKKEDQFHFIMSQTIVFGTPHKIIHPREFTEVIPRLSSNSIFYHFIEAKRRQPNSTDDFSLWLRQFDGQHDKLIKQLKEIDPYFLSLSELKQALINVFSSYFSESPASNS